MKTCWHQVLMIAYSKALALSCLMALTDGNAIEAPQGGSNLDMFTRAHATQEVTNFDETIRNWAIAGPFPADIINPGYQVDYEAVIALFSREERAILNKTESLALGSVRTAIRREAYALDFYKNLKIQTKGKESEAFIALANLRCQSIIAGFALIGHDEGIALLVNGKEVWRNDSVHSVDRPNFIIPIEFARGDNTLQLIIANASGKSGASLRLVPTLREALSVAMAERMILRKNIYSPGEELSFWIPTSIQGTKTDIVVRDRSGRVYLSDYDRENGSVFGNGVKLANGVYYCEFNCNGIICVNPFLVGDPAELLKKFSGEVLLLNSTGRSRANIDTLINRINILMRPENIDFSSARWTWKLRYTFAELDSLINYISDGEPGTFGAPGLHIRGFFSLIDDSIQHYRVYAPIRHTANADPLPVIVMLPTVTSASRPFIESVFIAGQGEAEDLSKTAEELGAILVWPGFRCQPFGNPIEFTHIQEVLTEVGKDYNVDPDRISVIGSCSAAVTAQMCALRFPGKFSAIGIHNGIFHRYSHRFGVKNILRQNMSYRRWIRSTDPAENTERLGHVPIYIINDGTHGVGHGRIEHSIEYLSISRQKGSSGKVHFIEVPEPAYGVNNWKTLFSWAIQQRRSTDGVQRGEHKLIEYETIGEALARRFVLVQGSTGSVSEVLACEEICRRFQEAWERTHHVKCLVRLDTSTDDVLSEADTLIVIGNERTNRIWNNVHKHVPLRLSSDLVKIDERSWRGDNIGVQAVLKHPLNSRQKLVFIGAHDITRTNFETLDLSVDGWYKFSLWRSDSRPDSLIEAVVDEK